MAGTSPADMTDEEIADEVDDLHDRIEALRDATDSVDLAYRFRLEKRKFELEDAERRRWKPTPEYDDDGKVKERDRGDVIRDRLSGYGLNDAEAVGLVERVEDLPAAKEHGYSDEEWARISAEASARESYPPTEEQNIIIEGAARRGLNMAVMALAGTGKSSTLKMLSHRMPGKKIVYLAFNRSVAAEAREAQARGEYAKNLTASTANAYAAKVADKRLNNRLPSNRRNGFKKLSAQQIADRMRWYDTVKAGNRDLSPGGAATVAERMIREWAKSADAEMLPKHITGAKSAQERRDLFNAVKPLADRMWDNLTDPTRGDPDEDLTMDFDYIVKMWALGGYKLDADTLFWDEAQDVNPVMEGVVRGALAQGVQVVAVGDSNQAIYGFRGAADALGKLPVDARATLTQSFRFGPAVADAGNRFLRLLGTRMRLKGFDRKQSRLDTIKPGDETMVIARTNAGVALAAVEALSAGRRVAVSGGVKDLQEFVQAARALANGERTDHAELARFNGMAFDDILEAVKGDPDLQQLKSLFDLLEKHADDIDKLLESGAQRAETENVGGRVWVNLDWNDPKVDQLKRWLGDGKNNGVGKLLYDPATRRYFYEPGKRDVPWKNERSGRSGVHKVDNKLSLEEAQQKIDAHLAKLYPQEDSEGGRLVDEKREHDVLVTTAHKSKGLESERVRIADDFRGPEYNEHGNIKWETIPDDEALRVAYVALTRATDVLDAGSLGWVFQATREDDPTLPPNGDYRRDWVLDEFNVGDRIDFQEEDGTPNVGTVDRIDAPGMYVRYEVDGQDREQWIGPAQVLRLNGQGRPQLPVASDEELDRALAEGRYEPVSTTPAPSADTAPDPAPSPSADAPETAAGRQWGVDDWVVTPNGEGRVIVSDGDKVIVLDGGGAPRTYEPRQLSMPGEARTAEHDAPTAKEAARQEKRQRDSEAAQSPEGLQLFYGSRLANLNLDEGHGQVLDEDGNVVGWVRRRGSVWLGQDARGGTAQGSTAESASDPLHGPREAAQQIDGGLGDSHMRLPLQDTSWRHLRPEEGRDEIQYSEFSDAQREQFFKLIKGWEKSSDSELSQAAQGWSRGLNYQQMERIAAAFTAAADDVDTSTPEGRREQAVLNRAADKVRAQARRAWLNWQTMPPPGEPDVVGNYDNPEWVPYGHRGDAGRSGAPAPTAAGDGADAPAAASRYGGDMVPASEIREGDWVSVDQDDIFGRGPGRIVGKVTGVRVYDGRVTFDVSAKRPKSEKGTFGEHAIVGLGDLVERLPEGNPGREDTSDLARRLEEHEGEQRARRKRVPEGWTAVEDPMSIEMRPGDRFRVRDLLEHGTRGRQMYKEVVVRGSEPVRFDSDGIALWGDELNPSVLFRQHNIVAVPEDRVARSGGQNAPAVPSAAAEGTRERAGEFDGKPLELGEPTVVPHSSLPDRADMSETRRAVYLDGERIGSLQTSGGPASRGWVGAHHDVHGSLGWFQPSDGEVTGTATAVSNPAEAAALAVAEANDSPMLGFPGDTTGRADGIKRWAGVWAEPQPAGVRNAYLDRVLAHHSPDWLGSVDPERVRLWLRTAVAVDPLAQYDENTRRNLAEAPPEARQYLAGLAADLRSSVQQTGEELRLDLRRVLVDHIATEKGREKARELAGEMFKDRTGKIRTAVREQIARARAGAAEHGLSEQQAEDFIVNVVGGDNPDQVALGVRGAYPEAMRPLHAAKSDADAYWSAFAGWARREDSGRWHGQYWDNGRRTTLGAPPAPFADAQAGSGVVKVGEAELPKGMRWARGSDLRQGDIFHAAQSRQPGDDTFNGLEPPSYVIHTHRGGREGDVRSVTLDSDHGQTHVKPDQWVVIVEDPEPAVRKKARSRARTDTFTQWEVPVDDETYELGGPDRVSALAARAELTPIAKDKFDREAEWTVSVDGVEIGRIENDREKVLLYHSETSDGQRRTWHGQELAKAGLVAAHDAATGRGEQDDDRPAQTDERDRRDGRREDNDDQRAPKREREGREGGSGGGGEPPNGGDAPQRPGDDDSGQDSGRQGDGDQEGREDDDRRRRRNRSGNDRPRPEGAGGGPDLPRPRVPHMPDIDSDAPDDGPDGGASRSGDGSGQDNDAGRTLDRAAAARRFGSADRMRDLARQAVAVDDLGPAGSYDEVWMGGRLIGHAIHTTGGSWAPYSKFTRDPHPDFQEREGAVAELVRLAQEHGELPVDRLAPSTPFIGSVVSMPKEAPGRLDLTPEESERWRALSGLLEDLRAGRPASGNVADDISQAIDELDWVTGRYKPNRDEFWKPGADAANLRNLLNTIRPDNPRASHHQISKARAAWKALQALEESGSAGTATPIRDLRPGDVVRVMGKRPSWDINDTEYSGYLRGTPKRVTRTRDGQKERVWQLRLGSTPWDDNPDAQRVTPRHEMTVQVPADGTGSLLARADDVDMPTEDYVARSRATANAPDGTSTGGRTDGVGAGPAAPQGDIPRVPSTDEMREQYATGEKEIISAEGERVLFGSPERMRELAEEGTAPTPALQADQGEQVWRNGRFIGRLFAPHRFVNADNPEEVWWSQEPWDSRGINFSTREAAIANLVLRDKERGEPDLSVVPERLARGIALYDNGLAFNPDDEFRGYPSLEDNADDMRRYRGLRAHLAQLGRGESPSGNVADDLAHAHDELLWLDSTHYKEPESEQGKGHMVGPGSLARMLGDALNSLRPEDPRATHHQHRQDRAAKQFLDQLKADGGESRAVSVPVGELQPGDIVRLSGRITGLYPGATGDQIGYVVGKPARATITQNGKRTNARRIALSPSPRSQYGVGGSTFLIPADENVRRLMAAGDVRLPLDEHTYGRQLGETSRLDHPNGLDRAPGSSSAPDAGSPEPGQRDARAGGSATSQDREAPSGQAPARSEDTPVTGGAAAPSQGGAASRSGDAPARGTDASPTAAGSRSTGSGPQSGERTGTGTGGAPASRPQQSEAPAADTGTDEPPAPPEPVGGRPAEWVRVSDLGMGDLVRVDGTTKRGTTRTLAGYVVDGPREIQTTQGRKMQDKHRILISDTPDGAGSPVWVSPDAAAARATRDGDDTTVTEGSPRTGADSDVLTGRISGRVATDASGNGLFPGSLVTDSRGNDGVVVGANAATVQVRFGDDRTDDVQAPSSLNVTDGGAARPAGWTPDGHRVDVGHVVGDRDGNMLGTVEEVDGDTATVATPDGMTPMPVTGLRVLGGTADSSDQQPKVARVERVTAGDLREGDVMVRDGHPTKITGIERDEETTLIGSDDPDTGETDWQAVPNGTPVDRALDAQGGAPDLAPEDTPKPAEPITSHEPKPHVEPVTGPTVDPQLSPEERDAATDRSASATSDPDAEQAAARIGQDLPVTPQQASALADDLREGADPATPEGRAAKRAADHLDRAASPSGEAAGTTSDTAPEDVVIGGKRRAPNPLNPQINYIDGISREAWEQAKATYARSQTTNLGTPDWMFESMLKGIYGLKPDAIRDVLAHLKNGTEPAEFSRRAGTPDAGVSEGRPEPGTVGSVGEGDIIALPSEDNPDEMAAYRVVHIQEAAGGMRVLTVEDGDGIRSKRTLASGDALYQLPEPDVEPQAPTPTPAAGTDGSRNPNPAPNWDTVQNDYADAVARAVVDSAIEGTTIPGSIHALRQQIAEKVTTEALRDALQNLRRDLTAEVDLAGVTGDDRTRLLAGMRRAAAQARTAAVRAAVRTLDDLEPLDGETPEDTAKRAAELLRLIPESLRNRTEPSLNEGDGPAAGRVADEVSSHVSDAVTGALHDLDDGPLTPERRAQIVARLAGQMADSRDAAARRIAGHLPDSQMPGILAALVQIGRRVVELVAAFLKGLAAAAMSAARAVGRFVKGLARRVRSWPETRRLRRLQRSLPRPADGLSLAERMAHWGRLLPVPGRFGQVSRRARWYRRASRTALAAGQMPAVQDGMRWTADRAADRGPGAQALRHLAAVRAAGSDVDGEVIARLAAAAPELGDDPHGTVRHARRYAARADARLRDLQAAAAGGTPDLGPEIDAARLEAQHARQEAARLHDAYRAALPEAVRDALAEVREMGPAGRDRLTLSTGSDAEASRALVDASRYVPRDWLADRSAVFLTAVSGDAGGYDVDSGTATVADLGDGGRSTAAHALLAHLQQHYPDLQAAQETFGFVRTHTGRPGARRSSVDVLLERLFGGDQVVEDEIVARGLAAMFSGDWYRDDDLRAFLMGLLATR
ncbi:UvrD-helicase domain-containing protein [Streptomyces sp. E1N211]|uniref:UvrD-helicase domain-containing protein n=1 Tax=Streptomyces sp. E1N211 TaxID=1851876 RepID=UPI0012D8FB2E|nr:UvrD-helicase domain-containing protein [Streptomyces sp. E1N211]